MNGHCVDCNRPTSGIRCKTCHGAYLRLESLRATEADDQELLAMVEGEKLNGQQVATRYGVSKTRAYEKIKSAKRRRDERTAVAATP